MVALMWYLLRIQDVQRSDIGSEASRPDLCFFMVFLIPKMQTTGGAANCATDVPLTSLSVC